MYTPTRPPHSTRSDAKGPQLCMRLRELALQLRPHDKFPTVAELCVLFKTSRATLNDALKQAESLQIIYRKSGSGIFVSPHVHQKSICILFSSNLLLSAGTSAFWGVLWGYCMQEAQRRAGEKNAGYRSFLLPATEHLALPQEVVEGIQAQQVHGALFVGQSPLTTEWIGAQGVPCVTFAGYGPWVVELDHSVLIGLAVTHLEQRGCRRMALWIENDDRPIEYTIQAEYTQQFRSFLAARGLPFERDLVRYYLDDTSHGANNTIASVTYQEQGYILAQQVFGPDSTVPRPDGLIITNDLMTDGVLAAFQSLGVRVGEDIIIATHANAGSMLLFGQIPGMLVIEFDPAEIVQSMFSQLDLLMAGKRPEQAKMFILPHLRQSLGTIL